ncbi:MAG TPA: DJ-1/PfpI family protein [Planctomycetota bacterium]|nr:DJ-1/PfpI family protein [Planctomycetota bacterium]
MSHAARAGVRVFVSIGFGLAWATAVAVAQTPVEPAPDHGRLRSVGVLVFEGVELLDFTGPVEVFTEANGLDPAFRVFTVGVTREPLRTKNALAIVPDFTPADCPLVDVLVIPGGETRAICGNGPLAHFLRDSAKRNEITFSVCNGVFALTRTGMLDGLEATTHWSAIQWLRKDAPNTVVHADRRVIDNGHIVTSAGVSAGIDGALHIVDRLLGRATALRTARRMEYTWQPTTPELATDDAVLLARNAWYSGDFATAATHYAALVESTPQDAVATGRLGVCRALQRDFAAALPLLERARQLQPEVALWHQFVGFVHMREVRHDRAVTALERAFALAPDSREIRQFLGLEQLAVGHHREAIENLSDVWRRGGGDQGLLVEIAAAKLAVTDREGALRCLEEIAGYGDEQFAARLANPRFDALRDDARFARVCETAAADAARAKAR